MIKKSFTKTGNYCRVTFRLPPEINAEKASLCGDFNSWDPDAKPMTKTKMGGFYTTLSLQCRNSYRFRYLLDGNRWENDGEADEYTPNDFGSEDSVIKV